MEQYFEWDDRKAEINYRKHGIRFEEAASVFNDPLSVSKQDRITDGEQRWQTVGMIGNRSLLLVVHTVRFENNNVEVIRIISARCVDRKERRRYEHG